MHLPPKKTGNRLPRALQTRIKNAIANLRRALRSVDDAIADLKRFAPPPSSRKADRPHSRGGRTPPLR